MQRIMDVTRWLKLDPSDKLDFELTRPRAIRVEVNAPNETQLAMVDEEGEVHFLALVKGRDTVEFEAKASFSLMTDQPNTFIYSAASEIVHLVVEAPESYTRIMQGRRTRNPEMELLAQTMNRNFERQLAKQAKVYGSILERSLAASALQPAAEGASSGPAKEPESDAKPGPAGEADGAAGGREAGKGTVKPD